MLGAEEFREALIEFRLYDSSGNLCESWSESLRAGIPLTTNSKDRPGIVEEGVLQIAAVIKEVTSPGAPITALRRFCSMVDWYSDDGDLVSLHNDQSVSERTRPIEFTEVVFLETDSLRNSLVLMNGPEAQAPGSVQLRARNQRGATQTSVYTAGMRPFSLHKLDLRKLFPDLVEFCAGCHASLEGTFDARSLFSRPYVITDGEHFAGYHGGNLYQWPAIPRFLYKGLGNGEVNPMVAIRSATITTTVNLLNTHGSLEDDFWVDARLYNEEGLLVAFREKWLLARRNGVSRGDIEELIGYDRPFVGHIALSFSDDAKPLFPRRLQALLEYRSPASTARVMAWSDIWNARTQVRHLRDRLEGFYPVEILYGDNYFGPPEVLYRCYYRVWNTPALESFISITNSGLSESYRAEVEYSIHLYNCRGEELYMSRRLGPHATLFSSVANLFPEAEAFLAPAGIGVATVESHADLAVMHFSKHRTSGVYSAEHFLASVNYYAGERYTSCGA